MMAAQAPRPLLRALRHRNYRLFFGGQSLSMIGTWMQRVALSWLVYRLTGSAFLLGLVGFAGQFPSFLVAPFAGVLADRLSRHRILLATQLLSMLQALALAVLTIGGWVEVWHLIVLSLLLGVINGFDMPVRQSFMIEMVEGREDLGNAIALNSTMVNGSRLVGPALAGLLIATVGEGVCFLFNGLSYFAVITSLLAMRLPRRVLARAAVGLRRGLAEGLRYAAGFEPIWALLALLSLFSLTALPYLQLMPVLVREVLGGDSTAFGALVAATGAGALAGAWQLARRGSAVGLGRTIAAGGLLVSAGLIGLAASRNLNLSLLIMPLIGYGQMIQFAGGNTLLQTLVDDDKRGRVMSFYSMTFMGFYPLGSLLAGSLADRIGAPWTIAGGGLLFCAGVLAFARRLPVLRAKARPVFVHKGLLPAE
jgi:MFS family permease